MDAKERIYSTVDGRLVREGDPKGAFLKYAIGDTVGTDHEAQVSALADAATVGGGEAAYHDDDARDALRLAQAEPTVVNQAVAAATVTGDPSGAVFYHDRLATELADEARERANRNEPLDTADGPVAKGRLYWTSEDHDELVREGHPDSRFLAYAPGDKILKGHVDLYEAAMDDDADAAPVAPARTARKAAAAPANKQVAPADNK